MTVGYFICTDAAMRNKVETASLAPPSYCIDMKLYSIKTSAAGYYDL